MYESQKQVKPTFQDQEDTRISRGYQDIGKDQFIMDARDWLSAFFTDSDGTIVPP